MLARLMLMCMLALAFVLTGCANLGKITPEQAIKHALAANNVVAQCYADYQKQLDLMTAQSILAENGLAPVETDTGLTPTLLKASDDVVGSVPIPATPPITPD